MPTTLTGTSSGGAADPVVISAPAAGDSLTSAPQRTLLQKILDTIQHVRSVAAAFTATFTPSWSAAPYGTNWSAGSYVAVSSWKDPSGMVYIKGQAVAAAGAGGTIVTLAVADRPAAARYVLGAHAGGVAVLKVDTDGTIIETILPTSGPAGAAATGSVYSFDGISFVA